MISFYDYGKSNIKSEIKRSDMNKLENTNHSSNIDIIKIIAMFMICCLHFVGHGGAISSDNIIISESGYLTKSFCIIGVNLFALTSGYLLYNKEFKVSRIISIWTQTIFWSYLIFLITSLIFGLPAIGSIFKSLLPVSTIQYWYITAYIIMLLFIPVLNAAIQNLSKPVLYGTVITGAIVFCLWRMVFPSNGLLELGNMQGYGLIWLMCMYFTGGLLKRYPIKIKKPISILLYFGCSIIIYFSNFLCRRYNSLAAYDTFFDYSNLIVALSSVFLFEYLISINSDKLTEKVKKCLSLVASHTLAIYIIQEQICLKDLLWKSIYSLSSKFTIIIYFLLSAVFILTFYAVGIVLDWLRGMLFKRINLNTIIEKSLKKIGSSIKQKRK